MGLFLSGKEPISFFITLSVNYVNIMVGSLLNPLELCPDHFPCRGVLNKDPTVWRDGARPASISLIVSSIN